MKEKAKKIREINKVKVNVIRERKRNPSNRVFKGLNT